mmetsp:Transcript_54617/g.144852  ORF Transcript_54617/g.144852 Transcript_54617/m.144852 type:complete len:256 (+) Transcript_54617:758-1525(+)
MPARVRLRMPWVESTGSERRHASTTSASVTFSHLHTTLASGATAAALISSLASGVYTSPTPPGPSSPRLGTITGARFGLKVGSGVISRPASRSSCTTSSAIAGEPAMPGESMPAAWMKDGSEAEGAMIQSPAVDFARAPANEWKASPTSKEGTSRLQELRIVCSTSSFESGSTAGSAQSCWSRAVGPRMRLPQRVFCTRMPLPYGPGHGKRMWLHASPLDFLSSTYSPRRGLIAKESSPIMRATTSEAPPAQLTT